MTCAARRIPISRRSVVRSLGGWRGTQRRCARRSQPRRAQPSRSHPTGPGGAVRGKPRGQVALGSLSAALGRTRSPAPDSAAPRSPYSRGIRSSAFRTNSGNTSVPRIQRTPAVVDRLSTRSIRSGGINHSETRAWIVPQTAAFAGRVDTLGIVGGDTPRVWRAPVEWWGGRLGRADPLPMLRGAPVPASAPLLKLGAASLAAAVKVSFNPRGRVGDAMSAPPRCRLRGYLASSGTSGPPGRYWGRRCRLRGRSAWRR